jgi:hypothetical protein
MKYPIKSIFEQISEQVFAMNNLSQAQKFITDFVNEKKLMTKTNKVFYVKHLMLVL